MLIFAYRMNDLAEKLSKLLKDVSKDRDDLLNKLLEESSSLKKMMSLPLSIYFCAYRTEDYETGGEEYLTFTDCYTNLGGGLDAKSGTFTSPMAGAYLFVVHVCSADMSKALLALRYRVSHFKIIYFVSLYLLNYQYFLTHW